MNLSNAYNISNRPGNHCFSQDKDLSDLTSPSNLFPDLILPDDIVAKTMIVGVAAFGGLIASQWKQTSLPALVASTLALACPDPTIQLAGTVAFSTVIFGSLFKNFDFDKKYVPKTVYTPLDIKEDTLLSGAGKERYRFVSNEYTYGVTWQPKKTPSAQSTPLVKSKETAQEVAHD